MDKEQQRNYLILRMITLAMREGLSDVESRADFIKRTCAYGRGYDVSPAEVESVLSKPLATIMFKDETQQ